MPQQMLSQTVCMTVTFVAFVAFVNFLFIVKVKVFGVGCYLMKNRQIKWNDFGRCEIRVNKLFTCTKAAAQILQTNGLSPLCMLMCSIRFFFVANSLPHSEHRKFFSCLCLCRCTFKPLLHLND